MRRDSFLRRATIWLATIGYALVASGLPLPLAVDHGPRSAVAEKRLSGKDRSQPFPCMDKPCGCATAEQCFSNCCCNTPAELLAWAKANRVEPGLIAALRRRVAAPAPEAPAATSCCTAKRQATCCSDAPAELPQQPAESAAFEPVSRHTLVLSSMLACGGIVSQWLAVGGALPPPAVVEVVCVIPVVEPCADGDDVCRAEWVEPDAPPPRVV
ncbi:MAG: hypothetical protein WCR51_03110 [Planctomycetia bacterium]